MQSQDLLDRSRRLGYLVRVKTLTGCAALILVAMLAPSPISGQSKEHLVLFGDIVYFYPPGHAKNWKKHCASYRACGRPVYFVQDEWYHDVYAPHYKKHHGKKGGGKKHG